MLYMHHGDMGCGVATMHGFGQWGEGGWGGNVGRFKVTQEAIDKFLDTPMSTSGCYIGPYLKNGKITLRQWRDDPYRVLTLAVTAPRMNGDGIDKAMTMMGFQKAAQCQNPYITHPFDGEEGVSLWILPGLTRDEHEAILKKMKPKKRKETKLAAKAAEQW